MVPHCTIPNIYTFIHITYFTKISPVVALLMRLKTFQTNYIKKNVHDVIKPLVDKFTLWYRKI